MYEQEYGAYFLAHPVCSIVFVYLQTQKVYLKQT